MDPSLLQERLETACRSFESLERQLADPAIGSDPERLQTIARERARLEPLVRDHALWQKLRQEQEEARQLLREAGYSEADIDRLVGLGAVVKSRMA